MSGIGRLEPNLSHSSTFHQKKKKKKKKCIYFMIVDYYHLKYNIIKLEFCSSRLMHLLYTEWTPGGGGGGISWK